MLMSATTNENVEELKKLVLHNPVTLDLLESESLEAEGAGAPVASSLGSAEQIQHFAFPCSRLNHSAANNICNIGSLVFGKTQNLSAEGCSWITWCPFHWFHGEMT